MKKTKKSIFDIYHFREDNHELNMKFDGIEDFDGQVKNDRNMTDGWCWILWKTINLINFVLFFMSVLQYVFSRLQYGIDFRADSCGSKQLANKKYLYFMDPTRIGTIGMCVSQCPTVANQNLCLYKPDGVTLADDYCYLTYETQNYNGYCLPPTQTENRKFIDRMYARHDFILSQIAGDFWIQFYQIVISGGITLILGMLFYNLLTIENLKIAKFFIWFFVFVTILICGIITFLIKLDRDQVYSNEFQKITSKFCPVIADGCLDNHIEALLLKILFYLVPILTFLYVIYLIYKRKQINILLEGIQKTNVCLMQLNGLIPWLIFWQMVQIGVFYIFIGQFCLMMISGKVTSTKAPTFFPSENYRTVVNIFKNKLFVGYFYFVFLWWMLILKEFNRYIIGQVVATWFFSYEKTILPNKFQRAWQFAKDKQIGSIILSSLILYLIDWIRTFFLILKEKIKLINKRSKWFKFNTFIFFTCISVHENFLKYIHFDNLIYQNVFGKKFYEAGQTVFYLKFRNQSRLNTFKESFGFITLIGKTFISVVVTAIIYGQCIIMKKDFLGNDLSQVQIKIVLPIIVFVMNFYMARTFCGVIDECFSNICLYVCFDDEMFFGHTRYQTDSLREFMNLYGKESTYGQSQIKTKIKIISKEEEIKLQQELDERDRMEAEKRERNLIHKRKRYQDIDLDQAMGEDELISLQNLDNSLLKTRQLNPQGASVIDLQFNNFMQTDEHSNKESDNLDKNSFKINLNK